MDSAYGKIADKGESNLTVNMMPPIKDSNGKELIFDICSPPAGRRQPTEHSEENED